ncbi:MAG: glucose 1-dehydrogenase [Gammaproteobacteria bacterium]|nr:glucose 1-dehydrogenase [Gammaproteobacteria bacterium]
MMENTRRLENKAAVITGASRGIGRAIAQLFAKHGAYVVVHYHRSKSKAERVVHEIDEAGGRALAVQADVAQPEHVDRLLHTALDALGKIDIWANIAGADILTGSGAKLSDLDKLDRVIAVDLRGTILCCWRVAPVMRGAGGGVILNMSWDAVLQGMKGRNPEIFAAAKGGILGFTKCLARSYAPEVRVNELAPGWIETAFAHDAMPEAAYQAVLESTPMKRFGQPEDVAKAALYLASDEASFVTGQTIRINGGQVL